MANMTCMNVVCLQQRKPRLLLYNQTAKCAMCLFSDMQCTIMCVRTYFIYIQLEPKEEKKNPKILRFNLGFAHKTDHVNTYLYVLCNGWGILCCWIKDFQKDYYYYLLHQTTSCLSLSPALSSPVYPDLAYTFIVIICTHMCAFTCINIIHMRKCI